MEERQVWTAANPRAMLDVCREQEQQMAHWRMRPAQHAIPDLHKQLTSTFTLTQTRS